MSANFIKNFTDSQYNKIYGTIKNRKDGFKIGVMYE